MQPMDQQVISSMLRGYREHNLNMHNFWNTNCLKIIDLAWQGVIRRTLNSTWRMLWPEAVTDWDFEILEPETPEVENIVSFGKSMGLEVDDADSINSSRAKENWRRNFCCFRKTIIRTRWMKLYRRRRCRLQNWEKCYRNGKNYLIL